MRHFSAHDFIVIKLYPINSAILISFYLFFQSVNISGNACSKAEPVDVETRNGRSNLINEAKDEANKLGANAITGLRMETTLYKDWNLVELVLYGTAVQKGQLVIQPI